MNEQARRSTPAESSSFTYGPTFRLQLLSTPLRADAVTFGYGAVAYSGTDFHRADVAPSRAHSFRRTAAGLMLSSPAMNWSVRKIVLSATCTLSMSATRKILFKFPLSGYP